MKAVKLLVVALLATFAVESASAQVVHRRYHKHHYYRHHYSRHHHHRM